jgi:glycosyltransferase involved in cell wall biosynthesis
MTIREVFTPGTHLLTVPRGDPGALAGALRQLRDDPPRRRALGSAAASLLADELDYAAQGARLRRVLTTAFPELAGRFAPVPSAEERRRSLGLISSGS